MEEQITCPVCGKVGIPDYHKDEIVCPCCGTDLSIYKMLSDSQVNNTPQGPNGKWWKITTVGMIVVAIIATTVAFCKKTNQNQVTDDSYEGKLTALTDSIQVLSMQLNLASLEIANLKQESKISGLVYIVQKNDSPCRISRKLYGTESRYKEIEAIITKPLQPGDTLIIK